MYIETPYICSIFLLCIKSNAFEKSTHSRFVGFFFNMLLRWFDGLSAFVTLCIYFSKNRSGVSQELFDFKSDKIDKQDEKNLSSNSSKRYASVVLYDHEDVFFGKGKNINFYPFLNCNLFIDSVVCLKKNVVKFSCLSYFKIFFEEAFFLYISRKIILTCHISCVGSQTRFPSVS